MARNGNGNGMGGMGSGHVRQSRAADDSTGGERTPRPLAAGRGSHPVDQHEAGGTRMVCEGRLREFTPEDKSPMIDRRGASTYGRR